MGVSVNLHITRLFWSNKMHPLIILG